MTSQSPAEETLSFQSGAINRLQGEGSCKVGGCGCTGFSAAPGFPEHCIGKNSGPPMVTEYSVNDPHAVRMRVRRLRSHPVPFLLLIAPATAHLRLFNYRWRQKALRLALSA